MPVQILEVTSVMAIGAYIDLYLELTVKSSKPNAMLHCGTAAECRKGMG